MALLRWAVVLCCVAASLATNLSVRMLRDASSRGAVCNDGTASGYYIRAGDPTRWVIYLQGGYYCYDNSTCYGRCINPGACLCSSVNWPPTYLGYGIISDDPGTNPDFHNFTTVFIPYCTSDLYTGERDASPATSNLSFHGMAVVRAVMEDLANPQGDDPSLMGAKDVLFSGGSAGGVGSLVLYPLVKKGLYWANVRAAPDAGWFVGVQPFKEGIVPLETQVNVGYHFWGSGVAPECYAQHKGEEWICFSGPGAYSYLSDEERDGMFVHESLTDGFAIAISGISLPVTAAERPWMLKLMNMTLASVADMKHGFSENCILHTALRSDHLNCMEIENTSLVSALGNWFFGRGGPTRLVDSCRDYDCNPTCNIHWPCHKDSVGSNFLNPVEEEDNWCHF